MKRFISTFSYLIIILVQLTNLSLAQTSWDWSLATAPMGDRKVEGILIDPKDDSVWYVSTIESGLYVTRDAGQTWTQPLGGRGLDIEGIQIDPANSNTIYVTLWDKLYKSQNQGQTWQLLYNCPEYIRSLHISRNDGSIYLGPQTTQNDTPGIYKSTDGGLSFKHKPFGVSTHHLICWDIEEDPVNGNLYVPTEIADHPQPYNPPFFRSMDGGKTWSNISDGLNWHALKVQVDYSTSAVYFQEESGRLYRSTNFGNDWQFLHSSFFMTLLLDQQHSNRLFGGMSTVVTGGAYFSPDGGQFFTEIGLSGLSVSTIALNSSNTTIYAVAYDSGIWTAPIPENISTEALIITNTNDSNANSLREAIERANITAGPDTIRFAISKSDPGYEQETGVWRIRVQNALPDITNAGLVLDGGSQNEFIGEDSNPAGPEIIIDGSEAGDFTMAFNVLTSNVEIKQLCINNFPDRAISMYGATTRDNTVTDCYIGTDATGKTAKPNDWGIFIQETAANTITGNLISGNDKFGIYIMGAASKNNIITGNLIGTDITGTVAMGNGWTGISINSDNNMIGGSKESERNIISGSGHDGIEIRGNMNIIKGNHIGSDINGRSKLANNWNGIIVLYGSKKNIIGGTVPGEGNVIAGNQRSGISFSNADSNDVIGNMIGTGKTGEALGNVFSGISLRSGSNNNTIGPANVIRHNGTGVFVDLDSTVQNTITRNSITNNDGQGILNMNGGNTELAAPFAIRVTGSSVSGNAPSNATVEIFSDDEDEGRIYEGTVLADGAGNFEWTGTVTGPNVTATATDPDGNTSVFSVAVNITSVETSTEVELPENFSLNQNYPNPFNPSTTIVFSIAKVAKVNLALFDLLGRKVLTLRDERMQPGEYQFTFEAGDLSSGVYFYRLIATDVDHKNHLFTRKLTLIK